MPSSREVFLTPCKQTILPWVDLVLTNGAKLDELGGENGQVPLDFALSTMNYPLASVILKHGADPNIMQANGELWLVSAIREGNRQVTGLLLSAKAVLPVYDYSRCRIW